MKQQNLLTEKTRSIPKVTALLFSLIFLSFIVGPKNSPLQATNGPATLTLNPASKNLNVGTSFDVKIELDTDDKKVSATDIVIIFDNEFLQAKTVIADNLFPAQVELKNSIEGNTIRLSLATFEPYEGSGTLGTISFQTLKAGTAAVRFNDTSSLIIEADVAENILGGTSNASYTINADAPADPTISPTPPTITPDIQPSNTPTLLLTELLVSPSPSLTILPTNTPAKTIVSPMPTPTRTGSAKSKIILAGEFVLFLFSSGATILLIKSILKERAIKSYTGLKVKLPKKEQAVKSDKTKSNNQNP